MKKNKRPGRVKSALLNWLGVPISLTTGTFWEEWFGTSSSGKVVTADKAIQLRILKMMDSHGAAAARLTPRQREYPFLALTRGFTNSLVRQAWRQRDGNYCRQWTLAAWARWGLLKRSRLKAAD